MRAHTFETILVPVDFSEISAHALRTASLLAERCGRAKIVAMYANWFEAPPYFTVGRLAELQAEFSESLQLAEHSLKAFVRSTLGDNADSVEVRAMEALPADGIRQLAALENANLIVMGTHGRSGLNRWMLGSVAERVLRESPAPVLTVRSAPRESIRQVLCPVHDTELSRRALSFAAGIAACFDANLTVLHVHEASGTKSLSDLCGWIPAEERSRCAIRELVRRGDAAEEIVKLAKEEPYDLVVLGAARRRFFEGMVLGTTTLRTVRHAPCPVLTVGQGDELWAQPQDRR
ncbi:MAG: universal stress protein [Bryobacteraceae bacterium]